MGTLRKISPPNFGLSVVAGDSYKLSPDAKLGGMAALTYGRSYQLRDVLVRRFMIGPLPDGSDALPLPETGCALGAGPRPSDGGLWLLLVVSLLTLGRRASFSRRREHLRS
jgi:hypothetical protein